MMSTFERSRRRALSLSLGAVLVASARLAHAAPTWHEEAELLLPKSQEGDFGGSCVAVSGDTAVVGARGGSLVNNGRAYVLHRANGKWSVTQTLAPADLPDRAEFGWDCAMDADRLVVGASVAQVGGVGAAYVYLRVGTEWTLEKKLVPDDPLVREFGSSVAIAGDTLVVGAQYGGGETVLAFTKTPTGWSAPQRLEFSTAEPAGPLGSSVATDGSTILAGARFGNGTKGSAYVFGKSGGTWAETQRLTASDGASSDYFGRAVAISGATAVIGAEGKAYVFAKTTAWAEQQRLSRPAPVDDGFGVAVVLHGNTIAVGAPGRDERKGAVFVYERAGTTWTALPELRASEPMPLGHFGGALALSPPTLLVGAAANLLDPGKAYSFRFILGRGDTCSAGVECVDGFCVDGVCCDSACGGGAPDDCHACTKAKGAVRDGTCGPAASTVVCRAARSECDVAERCDHVSTSCPTDAVAANGKACAADGICVAGECSSSDDPGGQGNGAAPPASVTVTSCGCLSVGRSAVDRALVLIVAGAAAAGFARRRSRR